MTRHVLAYAPLAVWAAGVLLVGSVHIATAPLPSGSDKAAHFIMYGIGGALVAVARRAVGRGAAWPGLLFVAFIAAVDELHQLHVPGRQADPLDWVADIAGALVLHAIAGRLLGREIETG